MAISNSQFINWNQKPSEVIVDIAFAKYCDIYMYDFKSNTAKKRFYKLDLTEQLMRMQNATIEYLDTLKDEGKI